MQFSATYSWTIASFPFPVFLRFEWVFPEGIGTTLDWTASINGATPIPKNTVEVLFFTEAQDLPVAQINPTTPLLHKILLFHLEMGAQIPQVLCREEHITRVVPTTSMALSTFEVKAFFVNDV